MTTTMHAFIALGLTALMLGVPARARADETDNFTCRDQSLADRGTERVDRRIVGRDDEDVVMEMGRNRAVGHAEVRP